MKSAGWEIAGHGLKWIEHKDMTETEVRAQVAEAIQLHTEVTGANLEEHWFEFAYLVEERTLKNALNRSS